MITFVEKDGLLQVITWVCCTGFVGIAIVDDLQPMGVTILRVLDTLSCGSSEMRITRDSDTDVIGCVAVDDSTVGARVAGVPLRC